jgi:serine/threonine protein kinase
MNSAPSLAPGSVFAGDFLIERPLSEGGMGAVYVVQQRSTGKRRALKLMLPQLVGSEKLRQRFEQEARVGARIDSDHVVEVVTAGIDEPTGIPYLAMELLEGETLAALVDRRSALPPWEVREIYAQLGHALEAAHRAGIVHRDLKPENIFIAKGRRQGAAFTVKVLDFGIAKVIEEARHGNAATATLGTPLWMAPEQTDQAGTIAPGTDVWALGLIAFRLLTGRHYWKTANDQQTSITSILREVLFEGLLPPSARAMELGVGNLVPPGFDNWFLHCVNRALDQRFAHAGLARDALDPVLAPYGPPQAMSQPVSAPQMGFPQAPMPQITQQPAYAPMPPSYAPMAPVPVNYQAYPPPQQAPLHYEYVQPHDPTLAYVALVVGGILLLFGGLCALGLLVALVDKGISTAGDAVGFLIGGALVVGVPAGLGGLAVRWGMKNVRQKSP